MLNRQRTSLALTPRFSGVPARSQSKLTVLTRILHSEKKWANPCVVTARDSGACETESLLRCIRKAQFCMLGEKCKFAFGNTIAERFISYKNSKCKIRVLTVSRISRPLCPLPPFAAASSPRFNASTF